MAHALATTLCVPMTDMKDLYAMRLQHLQPVAASQHPERLGQLHARMHAPPEGVVLVVLPGTRNA